MFYSGLHLRFNDSDDSLDNPLPNSKLCSILLIPKANVKDESYESLDNTLPNFLMFSI